MVYYSRYWPFLSVRDLKCSVRVRSKPLKARSAIYNSLTTKMHLRAFCQQRQWPAYQFLFCRKVFRATAACPAPICAESQRVTSKAQSKCGRLLKCHRVAECTMRTRRLSPPRHNSAHIALGAPDLLKQYSSTVPHSS